MTFRIISQTKRTQPQIKKPPQIDIWSGVYVLRCQNNFLLFIHAGAHLFDEVAGDVFVVFHHLVDDAIRSEFDDAVGDGLDELVVVTAEEHIAFIELQVVVECLDALEVEMVGGCTTKP